MRRKVVLFLCALSLAQVFVGGSFGQSPNRTIDLGADFGHAYLTLRSCAKKGTEIQCDLTMTSIANSALDYKYGGVLASSKITDDMHIDHSQVDGYFIVGKNQHSASATLVKDNTIDIIQIFSGPVEDIRQVNLIFNRQYITTDLN